MNCNYPKIVCILWSLVCVSVFILVVTSPIVILCLVHFYPCLCEYGLSNSESYVTSTAMAKNSSTILINTTDVAPILKCYQPEVNVSTSFPVNLYQTNCNNLSHSNLVIVDHKSRQYTDARNPLPAVFDEGYPNYLTDANISVTVNVSSVMVSEGERLFICLYNDYSQFQTVMIQSSSTYWRGYKGTQCRPHDIIDGHETITEEFYISSPGYVFIGVGSTVDPLDTFQFNLNIDGQTISNPRPQSQISECIGLDDLHPSCRFKLNITDDKYGLCIISSRPVDYVSKEPFDYLEVKWLSAKHPTIKEIIIALSFMGVSLFAGIVLFVLVILVPLIMYRRTVHRNRPINTTPIGTATD